MYAYKVLGWGLGKCECNDHGDQRRVSDAENLELWVMVSHLTRVLGTKYFSEPSLRSHSFNYCEHSMRY